MNFLQVELAHLAKIADDKPVAVQASNGAHRSYSTASGGREHPGMFVGASRESGFASAGGSASDGAQASGQTTIDAVDLFELSPVAMPMGQAASSDPLKFGGRFHGLVDGGGSGSASGRSSSGGSQGGRGQKGLADCCDDPTTLQSDPTTTQPGNPLLTAPTLANAGGGPAPEASAWTLMILGFSLSGLVLRGRRRLLA